MWRHYMVCKALPQTPAWLELSRDTQQERWGRAKGEALDGFLARHPYPAGLDVPVTELGGGAKLLSAAGQPKTGALGIFDVIVTTEAPAVLVLAGPPVMRITLPASAELAYADVLRLAYEQHAALLDKLAAGHLARGHQDQLKLAPQPMLLQPMRKQAKTAEATRWWLADFWMF